MRSRRRLLDRQVDLKDLYAMNIGAYWRAMKNEHIAFWMLCFYYFFEYVRPQSLYPTLDILPYSQICMAGTLLAMFSDKSVGRVPNIQNTLFVLFGLVMILSGIMAFRPDVSWAAVNLMLGWFIVYFLTIKLVNSERRLLLFLVLYMLFNLKMAQHGAITWAQRGFAFSSWGLVGAPGFFRNSGEYAIQMLIYGSLAIGFVVSLKQYWSKYKRWILYAAAATGYMAVIGASSRGAQIALAVMGLWMLLRLRGGFKGLVAIIVIGGLLFSLLPDEQMERFRDIGHDKTSVLRLAHWEYGIKKVWPENPVLGVGYNNWMIYIWDKIGPGMGPVQVLGYDTEPRWGLMIHQQQPHSIYVQGLAELGAAGLFLFLMLALFAFINNARTRRMAREMDNRLISNLALALDAGMIGFLVAGAFVTVLYYPFFWIQMTMIVMLNNVASRMLAQSEDEKSDSPVKC
jgi:probable O-glycosylation ligase (exosortase A-associated)